MAPAKFPEPGQYLPPVGRLQAIIEARLGGHRRKADLEESEAAEMLVDPHDLDRALGDRDPGDDRACRVALEQALDAAHDLVVRALLFAAVAEKEAAAVLDFLGARNTDRHPQTMPLQEIVDFLNQNHPT